MKVRIEERKQIFKGDNRTLLTENGYVCRTQIGGMKYSVQAPDGTELLKAEFKRPFLPKLPKLTIWDAAGNLVGVLSFTSRALLVFGTATLQLTGRGEADTVTICLNKTAIGALFRADYAREYSFPAIPCTFSVNEDELEVEAPEEAFPMALILASVFRCRVFHQKWDAQLDGDTPDLD